MENKYLTIILVVFLVICGCSSSVSRVPVLSATRDLPTSAQVNTPFRVTINLDLDDGGKETVAVEETLPTGCSLQGSSVQSMDASTPTWLFDNADLPLPTNPRVDTTFNYDVVCTGSGTKTFSGQVSTESAGSRRTTGDTSIVIS